MNIETRKLSELRHADYNPRKKLTPLDPEYQKIARSIDEFGYVDPIIINSDNTIIGGHQRATVLKDKGWDEVKVVVLDIPKEQEKALNIALNKISGEWDMGMLKDLLLDIDSGNYDVTLTGFDLDEIEGLMLQYHQDDPVEDDDFDAEEAYEEIEEPETQAGDIWFLGKHRLMCGDSTDKATVEALMNGNKADMVFTDPPYGVDYEGINNDSRSGLECLLRAAFENYRENCIDGASVYCFHSDKCADIFHNVFRSFCHFSSMIIWEKQSLVLSQGDYQSIHEPCLYGWFDNGTHRYFGDRKQTSVWHFDRKSIEGHTTPKPIGFICKALENSSKKKEAVLDLFGGSGSTLIACEQLDRICYMMELDEKYCDVIVKRYVKLTGDTSCYCITSKGHRVEYAFGE